MKHKGIVLIILIAIGAIVFTFLPKDRTLKEIAAKDAPAPQFELKDLNGNTWRLSDLKGKVVLLNFWASWCPSCKTETPSKESLYKNMAGKPFQMLGVLFRDDVNDAIAYREKNSLTIPALRDPEHDVARAYGITGIPETFIIDKDGIVRAKIIGPRDWNKPENIALIEQWM
ncbi:MAG: TlpA family protein disulfide reductase [Nitrospirae bacterium]|nr:TlpA family protein disulfide reductase [Nitrospirota bacterium]